MAALGVIGSVVGIVLFADWSRNQYAKTIPEIAAKEGEESSLTPPNFAVKNVSAHFVMGGVQLICSIESAMFELGGKNLGFGMHVTTSISNPPIEPGQTAEYRCDPSAYMKIENGSLSLLGLVSRLPEADGAQLKLIDATVRVAVKYRTLGFQHESASETWELQSNSGFYWIRRGPVYR